MSPSYGRRTKQLQRSSSGVRQQGMGGPQERGSWCTVRSKKPVNSCHKFPSFGGSNESGCTSHCNLSRAQITITSGSGLHSGGLLLSGQEWPQKPQLNSNDRDPQENLNETLNVSMHVSVWLKDFPSEYAFLELTGEKSRVNAAEEKRGGGGKNKIFRPQHHLACLVCRIMTKMRVIIIEKWMLRANH